MRNLPQSLVSSKKQPVDLELLVGEQVTLSRSSFPIHSYCVSLRLLQLELERVLFILATCRYRLYHITYKQRSQIICGLSIRLVNVFLRSLVITLGFRTIVISLIYSKNKQKNNINFRRRLFVFMQLLNILDTIYLLSQHRPSPWNDSGWNFIHFNFKFSIVYTLQY